MPITYEARSATGKKDLHLWLPVDEYAKLKAHAESKGLTVTAWARSKLCEAAEGPPPLPAATAPPYLKPHQKPILLSAADQPKHEAGRWEDYHVWTARVPDRLWDAYFQYTPDDA